MASYKSEFIETIVSRGFLHQCTDLDSLDARAADGTITAYVGYDATADSLHIGHLVSIMMLHWLQKCGHRPIVRMGGGTTKVGDPSGKDETRKLLTNEQIGENISYIRMAFVNFLNFGDGAFDALMVNNAEWLDKLEYIPFLRDVGRHFTINRMLTFDSVRMRLDREQPLTFLEFNYMILQAYDFVELARRYDCVLQMGGSDQWGNIVNGIDLGRRIADRELYGLTTPLITTASGAKMGKTADGAVWLSADRFSPYDYWQFWRNTEDADVGRFLKLFTDMPLDEITRLEALEGAELNEAKKILANAATRMLHGADAADDAAKTAEQTFEAGTTAVGLPTTEVPRTELEGGIALFALLARAGLAGSNSEARRLIKGGGARVNDVAVQEETVEIDGSAINDDGVVKLSAGKKRHALIRPV
ncbi:MAG: tyrosine--tRNA ligase [Alphaproteobacteria bacterium]